MAALNYRKEQKKKTTLCVSEKCQQLFGRIAIKIFEKKKKKNNEGEEIVVIFSVATNVQQV